LGGGQNNEKGAVANPDIPLREKQEVFGKKERTSALGIGLPPRIEPHLVNVWNQENSKKGKSLGL